MGSESRPTRDEPTAVEIMGIFADYLNSEDVAHLTGELEGDEKLDKIVVLSYIQTQVELAGDDMDSKLEQYGLADIFPQ